MLCRWSGCWQAARVRLFGHVGSPVECFRRCRVTCIAERGVLHGCCRGEGTRDVGARVLLRYRHRLVGRREHTREYGLGRLRFASARRAVLVPDPWMRRARLCRDAPPVAASGLTSIQPLVRAGREGVRSGLRARRRGGVYGGAGSVLDSRPSSANSREKSSGRVSPTTARTGSKLSLARNWGVEPGSNAILQTVTAFVPM